MTLRSRNQLIFSIFIICLSVLITITTLFIIAGIRSKITPPADSYRLFTFSSKSALFSYKFLYSIIGIFSITVYAAAASILVYLSFEKTQSLEVSYFMIFIIGCLCEATRIMIPIGDFWKTSSTTLLFVGRIVLIGRILCPVSLLFASLFSENDQRQNLERNIIFLTVISIVLAIMIPLDSYHVTSTLTVLWGRRNMFKLVKLCLFFLTFLSLLVNTITKYSKEALLLTIGYSVMISGYLFLTSADNLFFLIMGIPMLGIGSFYYLKSIHSLYLWK